MVAFESANSNVFRPVLTFVWDGRLKVTRSRCGVVVHSLIPSSWRIVDNFAGALGWATESII